MSLGSLNAYEEYPARWCWVPPSCRCYEEEPSDTEESPQLSIFELELERREYERKTQEMRPFLQKRMYWCFSLRRWQVMLLFFLIFGAFVGLLSASLYYCNEIIKKKNELRDIIEQLSQKHEEIKSAEERARRAEEKKEKLEKSYGDTKAELKEVKEKNLFMKRVAVYNTGIAYWMKASLSSAKREFERLRAMECSVLEGTLLEFRILDRADRMIAKINKRLEPHSPRPSQISQPNFTPPGSVESGFPSPIPVGSVAEADSETDHESEGYIDPKAIEFEDKEQDLQE